MDLLGGTMNKSDLVEALSKNEGLTKSKAEDVVDLVFDEMTNALADRDRVEIRGLGSFKVKSYGGYKGRNPKKKHFLLCTKQSVNPI